MVRSGTHSSPDEPVHNHASSLKHCLLSQRGIGGAAAAASGVFDDVVVATVATDVSAATKMLALTGGVAVGDSCGADEVVLGGAG